MDEIDVSSETENLAQDYVNENPSTLDDATLQEVAKHYGLSVEKVKAISKEMSKNRNGVQPNEEE